MSSVDNIGVFTSGGDSPGMNACIRAVVRTSVFHGKKITGIRRGFQGMIEGDFDLMNARSVSNIIHRGGTILKSARSKDFMSSQNREKAYSLLRESGINGLIAIGGDGTFRGAAVLQEESGIPVMGIPGTIDNDLNGTDFTLGFDTAVNTAVDAIDKIRDTAASHDRLFFIEVMGRDAGYIALWSGIAGGAEAILLPEEKTNVDDLIATLKTGAKNQKSSSIVIVAEGDDAGDAAQIARKVNEKFPAYETRVTVLGHVQRGGSPTVFDRMLGSRLGIAATEGLINGMKGKMAGLCSNKITFTDFADATKQHTPMDPALLQAARMLSI